MIVQVFRAHDDGLGPRARDARHLVGARRVEVREAVGGAHVGHDGGARLGAARHQRVLRGELVRVRRVDDVLALEHGAEARGARARA